MPWSRPFDSAILPPKGKPILTLKDAAAYMMKLQPAERAAERWILAAEVVIMAAEDRGPVMHAEIGMRCALNFGKAKPDQIRRKTAKQYQIIS